MTVEWTVGGRTPKEYTEERQKRIHLWRKRSGSRVLICGDSYSDPTGYSSMSWIARLEQSHPEVLSKAVRGASNWEIFNQLKTETWTLAIVNLTSLKRTVNICKWDRIPPQITRVMPQIVEQNKRIAKQIIALPNTVVWSPFPDYETWPDVHYRELRDHDDMWVDLEGGDSPPEMIMDNHYTRKGNDITYQWVTSLLDELQS